MAAASNSDWQAVLDGSPAQSVFRLICPRRLRPSMSYLACLVPTFEVGRLAGGALPASPPIAPGQAGAVVALATAWLNWCAALLDDQPADAAACDAQRMEYAFAVPAQVDGGRELTLAADVYRGDPIDWHAFDGDFSAPLGATAAPATSSVCVIPSPIRFPGMPAPRWWQLEDAHADLGSIDVTRDDLARLVLTEFGLVYGNDGLLVPLPLPVGTLSRVTSLTLTGAFGRTEQVPHYAGR